MTTIPLLFTALEYFTCKKTATNKSGYTHENYLCVLSTPDLYIKFKEILVATYCLENTLFYEDMKEIARLFPNPVANDMNYMTNVRKLIEKYVEIGSPCELNIPDSLRSKLLNVASATVASALLSEVLVEVHNILFTNSYPRFLIKYHLLLESRS